MCVCVCVSVHEMRCAWYLQLLPLTYSCTREHDEKFTAQMMEGERHADDKSVVRCSVGDRGD